MVMGMMVRINEREAKVFKEWLRTYQWLEYDTVRSAEWCEPE